MSKKKKETIEVEYFRCWGDKTWDTEYIIIPADTPPDKMDAAIREAAGQIKWTNDSPVFVGLYHYEADDVDLDDDE